jgi:hypothetical protein
MGTATAIKEFFPKVDEEYRLGPIGKAAYLRYIPDTHLEKSMVELSIRTGCPVV